MGYDVTLRYLRSNPGPHTVPEIAEACGIELTYARDGNLRTYLRHYADVGWLDRTTEPRPGGGKPITSYEWRGDV